MPVGIPTSGKRIMPANLVEQRLDEFAERISEHNARWGDAGGSVRKVCKRMGISVGTGNRMMKRLRADLGWQADG